MCSNMFGEVKLGQADYTVVWENVKEISANCVLNSW